MAAWTYALTQSGGSVLEWDAAEPQGFFLYQVRPDASGTFALDGRSLRFWLEHDQGTEAAGIVADKFRRYATEMFPGPQGRQVLLLTLTRPGRLANLHKLQTESGLLDALAVLRPLPSLEDRTEVP
ncbi:replication-relaxation family protein [Salininema proteolyticum]|uniref:Replication-relaxation family protein n=1 Tax=Salininema proteolyticum TaxID=1607685 RepID=A0ABV8TXP1_9ACTN